MESNIIHPHYNATRACTVMDLTNLAEPNWLSVSCYKGIHFTHIVCVKTEKYIFKAKKQKVSYTHLKCPKESFVIKNKCFTFVSQSRGNKIKGNVATEQLFGDFHHLLDALLLENSFIFIYFQDRASNFIFFKVHRYLNAFRVEKNVGKISNSGGLLVYMLSKTKILYGTNLFKCREGSFITHDLVCNEFVDCPYDKSDEEQCICKKQFQRNLCKYFIDQRQKTFCNHLYHTTLRGECQKYDSFLLFQINVPQSNRNDDLLQGYVLFKQLNKINVNHSETFNCSEGEFKNMIVDDIISDCGPKAEDEPILKLLLNKSISYICSHPEERPCLVGHKRCYNIKYVCTYKLDKYHHLTPCRNGGHLNSCSKFECNLMFKCFKSYCISWSYVCNGRWDCPYGDDENPKQCIANCKNKLKCRGASKVCVHLGNMCDNVEDCPFGDDELFCNLQKVICPVYCNCLLYAIECKHITLNSVKIVLDQKFMFILLSNVTKVSRILQTLGNHTMFVLLPQTYINDICDISHFSNCLKLNLRQNLIQKISKTCLSGLPLLYSIILSENNILIIEELAFHQLFYLKLLNISHNPITVVPILFTSSSLFVVHMEKLHIQYIDIDAFTKVTIKVIITRDYHICCMATPNTKCVAHKPWYISCCDILPTYTLKVFFRIISLLIIFLNTISVMLHAINFKVNRSFSVIAIFVNVGDTLSGIYLAFIWVADISLAGIFSVKEHIWRSGTICLTAFTIILGYTILSEILLFLLAFFRLMVVINPLHTKFIRIYRFVISVLMTTMYIVGHLLLQCITSL